MTDSSSIGDYAWWALRTALTVVIALVMVRAVAEYVPALEVLPPIHALVRYWDPAMTGLLQPLGIPWTHDVRGFGLLAVGIALIVLRTLLDDVISSALKPGKAPKAKPKAKATAPVPADRDPDDPGVKAAAKAATAQAPSEKAAAPAAPGPAAAALTTSFLPSQTPKPPAPPEKKVERIGRYDVMEVLGRGAMGVVYMGKDPTIGRTVAIKTISALGTGPEVDEYRQRFLIEARSAGRLNHPGIVSVYDVTDDDSGRPSLVLEYVPGTPLDRLPPDKKLGIAQVIDIGAQVARALAHAHMHGIIHRDVKPANVMLTAEGQAKLSDFGIAKLDGTGLTMAGQVLGTPAYMSPEQCTGAGLDARSDLFSLGSVLYTLATGQRPFPGDTFTSVAYNVVHVEPVPPSQLNPQLPARFDEIVLRCLAKSREERYANAADLASDLEQLKAQP